MGDKARRGEVKNNFKQNFQRLCMRKCKKELLDKMDITSQAFGLYKNGVTLPSIENLIIIADYFNVSVDKLIRPVSNDEEE